MTGVWKSLSLPRRLLDEGRQETEASLIGLRQQRD